MSDTQTRVQLLEKQIQHHILHLLTQELAHLFDDFPNLDSLIWIQDHNFYDDENNHFDAGTTIECLIINGHEYHDLAEPEYRRAAESASKILKQFPDRFLSVLHDNDAQFTMTRNGLKMDAPDEEWRYRWG
jgi:hypothetical protein